MEILLIGIIAVPVGIWLSLMLGSLYIYWLARNDVFFALVEEGTVKFVKSAGGFYKILLSYKGFLFAKDLRSPTQSDEESERAKWDIEEYKSSETRGAFQRFFHKITFGITENIQWIGVYPNKQVDRDRFTWTSQEQSLEEGNQGMFILKTEEDERMNHMIVRSDLYAFKMMNVNTKNMLPLNITVVLRIKIVNPYKARYDVEHWLEAIINEIYGRLRPHASSLNFQEINELMGTTDDEKEGQKNLLRICSDLITHFKEDWGAEVSNIVFTEADPASRAAAEALKAELAVFTATQMAKADRIQGRGKANRARLWYGAVSQIQGGPGMFAAEALKDSKITVYAPGDSKGLLPAFNVDGVQGPKTTEGETS